MSNGSKGTAIEAKAVSLLQALGYRVHRTVRTPIFRAGQYRGGQNNDVFGVFDLVALHAEHPVLLVQVTVKTKMRERERKVLPVAPSAPLEHTNVEVWGFVPGRRPDGQRFRVTRWNGLEWAEAEDQVCAPSAQKAKAA